MKTKLTVKKWQLVKWKAREECADLADVAFVAVGNRVFYKNRTVEEVILPAKASAVKSEAFADCKRLKAVTLPHEGNVGLSRRVFYNCVRLGEIQNTQMISSIGDGAFDGCAKLPSIDFGRDLRRIGEYAFRNCTALTQICLPSNINTLGRGAFSGCTELEAVVLEDGFSALSKDAFRDCISLKNVDFCNTLREIPSGAFRNCSALETMTVPMQITKIGANAFRGCARLGEVQVELGTVKIGAKAFADTPRLRSVTVPHTLKKLGFGAFGFGFVPEDQRVLIYVDNEYMKKRMVAQLRLCLSFGRAKVVVVGKTIEERKRERRRSTVEQKPTHLM